MKKYSIFLFVFLILINIGASQEINYSCGSEVLSPHWEQEFQGYIESFKKSKNDGSKDIKNTYVIPVIFHIIHSGQANGVFPNMESEQIYSQIEVLNQDFNGVGLGVNSYPATAFTNWSVNQNLPDASIDNLGRVKIASLNVLFCPAGKDASGKILSEPGINRINYNDLSISNPASFSTETSFNDYLNDELKPLTIWDPKKYFNIWITDKHADFPHGGIATGPPFSDLPGPGSGGTDTTDGVWVYAKGLGSALIYPQGTYFSDIIRGRILTHEAGHWLGLYHPNGFGACGTDYCNDTPPAASQHGGNPQYPLNPGSCSSPSNNPDGEMFMNFMDFTADPYRYMFTQDQVTRMQTAMTNSPNRNSLGTHDLCDESLSLEENDLPKLFQTYPNPTDGIFTLDSYSLQGNIIIYDALGQIVYQSEINKNSSITFNISHLSNGIYFIHIQNKHSVLSIQKLIKY